MKKVLSIVLNNFTHDSRVLKECQSLQKGGYDVSVLALHDDSEGLAVKGVTSGVFTYRIRLTSKSWSKKVFIQVIKYLEFIIRSQKYCINVDILHCNDLNALIVGVVSKLISLGRLKIVYDAHELECEAGARSRLGKKFLEFVERLTIPFADHVITVSPSIAADYSKRYGIDKPTLVLNAPLWVNEVPKRNVFREKYGIRTDQKIFLYQGGLTFDRAVKELIHAFSSRKKDDAVLVFMGYGEAEGYIKEASKKCRNIFLHPAVPPEQIIVHTCGADYGLVFLHIDGNDSYYYCLPNKFFEYATCGLPLLTNNLYDIGRMNDKYHMAVQVKSMGVNDINFGIDKLMNENYKELSFNARTMAKQFSWEKQARILMEVYGSL